MINTNMPSISIIGLFPTPIAKINLERDLSSIEKNFICNQNRNPKKIEDMNLVSQTINSRLLDDDILCDLKSFFEKSLNDFFQEILKPSTNVCLKITQSWANYTNINEYHHGHNHPNSVISGVFYVNTNENSDKIIFSRNAHTSITPYAIDTEEYNLWNANHWELDAEEGSLLLFPSTLYHRVPSVIGEKERISISFNTFFSGEIGRDIKLNQLIFT
jgi:uncharacterized protein (TIGR02466 family)